MNTRTGGDSGPPFLLSNSNLLSKCMRVMFLKSRTVLIISKKAEWGLSPYAQPAIYLLEVVSCVDV